jgi:hypothetical protein
MYTTTINHQPHIVVDGGGYIFNLIDPPEKIRILYRAWKISDLTSSGGYFSKIFMEIFGSKGVISMIHRLNIITPIILIVTLNYNIE